jgi:hypothetical protein
VNNDTIAFTSTHTAQLNAVDKQVTEILLIGERISARKQTQRQHWSPEQHTIALRYSYWKQKAIMAKKHLFHWPHLEQLSTHTDIQDHDHLNRDLAFILTQQKITRAGWKACKKWSEVIRRT